ncbi:ABC transporter permease [Bacillus sp. B190/17]|uniref:ABC transporter permease n=1 Tax=Bacillus lumedeiriae TaxID=3058829 RepID=A0ABW8I6R6_9BACI
MGVYVSKGKYFIRKPLTWIFLFIPLTASLCFGMFLSKQQAALTIPVAVVDEDRTNLSKSVIKELKKQPELTVESVTALSAKKQLLQGEVDSVIIMKEHFQTRLLKGEHDQLIELWTSPLSAAAGIVREITASEVIKQASAVKAANKVVSLYEQKNGSHVESGAIWKQAFNYTMAQWQPAPLMTVHYETWTSENQVQKKERSSVLFSSYLGLWSFFTLLSCFVLTDWAVKERLTVFPRIRASSMGLPAYLYQCSAASLTIQLFQAGLSVLAFHHLNIITGRVVIFVVMAVFILFCTATALLFALYHHHLGSFYLSVLSGTLLFALIGGSFFPASEWFVDIERISSLFPQAALTAAGNGHQWGSPPIWRNTVVMAAAAFFIWIWTIWKAGKLND